MARVKTLYVRDEDVTTWEEAARAARAEGMSVSEFVVDAVRDRLARRPSGREFRELSFESEAVVAHGQTATQTVRIVGRWLVKDVHSTSPGADQRETWSIAVMRTGFFVAHVRRQSGAWHGTGPDLDELERRMGVPADVITAASEVLRKEGWTVRIESGSQ